MVDHLRLRAAEVETTKLVAGIAMGLVTDGAKYAVLTDIMGLEDHDGDMDFKMAGTANGITALQMDIKLGGIEMAVLKDALGKATKGKKHILRTYGKCCSKHTNKFCTSKYRKL